MRRSQGSGGRDMASALHARWIEGWDLKRADGALESQKGVGETVASSYSGL